MTTFRAVQVTSPQRRLALVDRALTDPAPGTVRVAVEACGICHSDAIFIDGQWPGLQFPLTPGHEIAGRIDALGEVCRVGVRVNAWRSARRAAIANSGAAVGAASWCTARPAWSPAQRFPAATPNTSWRPRTGRPSLHRLANQRCGQRTAEPGWGAGHRGHRHQCRGDHRRDRRAGTVSRSWTSQPSFRRETRNVNNRRALR